MKAMIIGAAGFVGPYLIEAIKTQMNCGIVATKLENEILQVEDCKIVNLNILDIDNIVRVLETEKPDYIFYLAAQSSVAKSWEKPALTVEINISGAINLLNSLLKLEIQPRVLMVGSGEEYGYLDYGICPISENAKLNPGNIYAVTKACQNMMSTIYAHAYGQQLIMTRSFNHIGPGQAPQFVVSDFCNQVAQIESSLRKPQICVGNLSAKRDFTDVRDVVIAYTLLMKYGRVGETYNVGSGEAVSIQEVLNLVLDKARTKIEVIIDEAKLRPVDIPIIEADITKIYRDTGWKRKYTIEHTIEDTLEYWRRIYR